QAPARCALSSDDPGKDRALAPDARPTTSTSDAAPSSWQNEKGSNDRPLPTVVCNTSCRPPDLTQPMRQSLHYFASPVVSKTVTTDSATQCSMGWMSETPLHRAINASSSVLAFTRATSLWRTATSSVMG